MYELPSCITTAQRSVQLLSSEIDKVVSFLSRTINLSVTKMSAMEGVKSQQQRKSIT